MRKLILMTAVIALLAACTSGTDGKGEKTMQIKIENKDAWIYAEWQRQEEDCEYEVSLFEQGQSSPFRKKITSGTTLGLTDYIAWYYQETLKSDSLQHPLDLVVKVKAVKDGRIIAQGESDPVHLSDVFPPEEVPQIGKEIPKEDITEFTWSSSGSEVFQIFNYSVSFDPEDPFYYASWFDEDGKHDVEKETGEEFRNRVLDLIAQGEMVREYVMDPDIEILDGSEESFRIRWKDMKGSEKQFCRLRFSGDQKKELLSVLRNG